MEETKGDSKKEAKKGPGKGNRRSSGKRAIGGVPYQKPWREDPIILDRVRVGMVPWMERRDITEALRFVNEYMGRKYPNEPPITLRTIETDRSRALQLQTTDVEALKREHIAEIDYVIKASHARLESLKDTSQNVTGLTNAILAGIEKKGKFDASLVERKHQTGSLVVTTEGDEARALVAALRDALGNDEAAIDRVLEALERDAKSGEATTQGL